MQGKKCETKGFGVLSLKCLIWLNKVGMIYNLNGSVKQSDYTPPPPLPPYTCREWCINVLTNFT